YAAGHYDPQTGLVRYGARDYDAALGRWLAKDPSLIAGGDPNLYAYVDGDPIGHVDPDGRRKMWYDYVDTSHDGWLQNTSDFFAGFGDFISGGLTADLRELTGVQSAVNPCSNSYDLGLVAGIVHTAITFVASAGASGAAPSGGRALPTFGNLGDDAAGAVAGTLSKGPSGYTLGGELAGGSFDFVVREGQVIVGRGHAALSGGGRVTYAGEITLQNGQVIEWTNASGHFRPAAAFAPNAGLPMGSFRPVRFPGFVGGSQLPVFQ
ncbi:MAG: RHS repeat-associated core domain-containing protein, partial [Myxococcota bacterium]|nr:RHS repeat-associated core domain-containing protein [Myxococcota bacterium]